MKWLAQYGQVITNIDLASQLQQTQYTNTARHQLFAMVYVLLHLLIEMVLASLLALVFFICS